METRDSEDQTIDVMELHLKQDVKIIDLTNSDAPLIKYCCLPELDSFKSLELAYLVPNFFASCCRFNDIVAIRYPSSKMNNATNYVFLDYLRSWFKYINIHSFYPENGKSPGEINTSVVAK